MIENIENFKKQFYSIKRLGIDLSDGGGPFGFDIHKAYDVCTIIDNTTIDLIIETGCNTGDTTEFLAVRYPDIKIIVCDTNPVYVNLAEMRLKQYKNVEIYEVSSEYLVNKVNQEKNTLFYLDAHWGNYHPLEDELKNIQKGYVIVDDFNIGCSNFGFDVYKKIIDINILKPYTDEAYINNPFFKYPFPNHQVDRKAGRAFFQKGYDSKIFQLDNYKKILNAFKSEKQGRV